jgi:2'-5' RNA ligase
MTRTIIASLPEARAALAAAKSRSAAAELESPPEAASIYGVLWFAELNRALLAEFPDVPFTLTLDCGTRADLAHAALGEGIKRIRVGGHPEASKALHDIAAQMDAELVASRPERELLYVIAEPDISVADRNWIQSIRKRHDPQVELVGPHFTLVFGIDALAGADLVARAQMIAKRIPAFAFELSKVEILPDGALEYYVFLTPGMGAAELTSLHEALSRGPGNSSAFVPHLTLGRFASVADATILADELNAARRTIRGRLSALKVIAVACRTVRELATVALKEA